MRENPASNRRHGSCFVLHKDVSTEVGVHQTDNQEVFIASEASRVESATTKGFATGERREEAASSTTIAGLTKAHGNPQAMVGGDDHAKRQAQHTASEAEFERLLDVAEAARLLRIHPKTLRVKAGHGIIPGIQIGRVWRFRASMLNRWLEGITGDGRRQKSD
jgi:excisionase family DNA binding protein